MGGKKKGKYSTHQKIFSKYAYKQEGVAYIGWQTTVEQSLEIGRVVPFAYISSYKEAADELVDKAVDSGLEDLYVFPIMFLYRQYLELILKNMYFKFSEDSIQKKGDFVKKYGHKLSPYWKKCEQLLCQSKISSDDIDKIGSLINDFERIDEYSFVFRYYLHKNSNIILPKDLFNPWC